MKLFHASTSIRVDLAITWVPRDENDFADQISKHVDYDDWKTSAECFRIWDNMWGPHTVDRFANDKNRKVIRFNSKYWCPGCEAVDAFSQDWHGDTNWLVLPVYLASSTIRHAEGCRASGTLLLPYWQSAPYWPLLFDSQMKLHTGIIAAKVFRNAQNLLKLGEYGDSLMGSNRFTAQLVAVKLMFPLLEVQ